MPYPVTLKAHLPAHFDRTQLAARIVVLAVLGVLHQTTGGLLGALYLALPVIVAVLVVQKGGARFLSEDGRWVLSVLQWVVALYAYLLFVTDRLPLPSTGREIHVVVQPGPPPTASRALIRLVLSLPHALALAVLGAVACLVGLVAAISILLVEHYPETLQKFQRDVLAWMTRLLAYHSSLVEPYPPFSLAVDDGTPPGHDHPRVVTAPAAPR